MLGKGGLPHGGAVRQPPSSPFGVLVQRKKVGGRSTEVPPPQIQTRQKLSALENVNHNVRLSTESLTALLQLLTDLPDFLSLWEGVIPEAAFEQKLRRFHHLIGGTWLHSLKWVPLFWRKERGRAAAQHILLATALVSFPSCLRRGVAEFVDGIPEVKTNPISLPCFPLRGT